MGISESRNDEAAIAEEAFRKLGGMTGFSLTFDRQAISQDTADGVAILDTKSLRIGFAVEVKRQVSAQNVNIVVRQVRATADATGLQPLLISYYINPKIAEKLRSEGICYLDTVGNAFLRSENLNILTDRGRPEKLPKIPRSFGRKKLQVIAVLLAHREFVNSTAREIASAANVGLGTVPGTLQEMKLRGFLVQTAKNTYEIRNRAKLLELWVQGYADVQRPHLFQRRYRLIPEIGFQNLADHLQNIGIRDVLVGGETAAAVYTDYLRPAQATLHVINSNQRLPTSLLLPDSKGNVDVLSGFGTVALWQGHIKGYVHPLLAYAELLAVEKGDRRLAETAELLLEKYSLFDEAHSK